VLRTLALVVLLVIAGVLAWANWATVSKIFHGGDGSDRIIRLSGRIEGDDSAVASKTSGRILDVRVREGDSVNAGQILAVLDDQQVRAREEQARGAVEGAVARTKVAKAQIEVLEEQLRESQLQTEQATVDAEGRVSQAEADLAAAESDLARQEASLQLALFDKDSYTRLAQSGVVSQRQGKEAVSNADQQTAAVAAAKRRIEATKGALTTAKANVANAAIRRAQTAAIRKQIAQQQAEIALLHLARRLTEGENQPIILETQWEQMVMENKFDGHELEDFPFGVEGHRINKFQVVDRCQRAPGIFFRSEV